MEQVETELQALGLSLPTLNDLSKIEIQVQWTVHNLIPQEGVTTIQGKAGTGKTYTVLQIGSCVADGKPFCGRPTIQENAYFIDFENPVPEICRRAKMIGGSNLRVWHLSHDPAPPPLDSDEWEMYKLLEPGLIIFDSLRASHHLDENSSRDMTFIMSRLKELRSMGFTVIGILHSSKADARGYRGSSALIDQCDHALALERVKKVGSDETVDFEDETDLPLRLSVVQKTRFAPCKMYLSFDPEKGMVLARDPGNNMLREMFEILTDYCKTFDSPSQTQFKDLVRQHMGIGKDRFLALAKRGEQVFWTTFADRKRGNRIVYTPVFCADEQE